MRVLLVAPGEFRQHADEFFSLYSSLKRLRVLPSLGLCSLTAVLRRDGCEVRQIDAYAEDLTESAFMDRVNDYGPDVVGITSTTPFFDMAARACRAVKKVRADLPVILGGPHVTVMKRDALALDTVDYGVMGEGERVLPDLLRSIGRGEEPSHVPNVLYKRGEDIIMTERVQDSFDLDSLPMPDRSDLPLDRYYDSLSLHKRAMSLMTTRGCPYRCLFCEEDVRGGRYRERSVPKVLEEIRHIVNDLGFKEILMYDDTFTVNRRRVVEICEGLLEENLKVAWDCRTRVDRVDPDLLALMRRAGCHRISFGVESASNRVRDILRKGITDEQIRSAFRWSRQAGIRTIAYFMIGTPGETRAEILQTVDYARRIGPDIAHFCITAPYPGTDLYRLGVAEGYVPADYWENYVRGGGILKAQIPYFVSDEYGREDLDKLLKRAYRHFYVRPAFMWRRLRSLRSLRELGWNIKLAREMAKLALG